MAKMNSTSFTSIDSSSDCAGNNDKMMANIDSSSTAHLTLNASVNSSRTNRSTRSSNNSDSDPDRSPSVTVLAPTGSNSNNIHHHHNHRPSLTRPSQLITGGFSLSNRLHLTKHQRTVWYRATSFEKILMLAVVLLAATTILLFISLVSILVSQKHLNELMNQTKSIESEDSHLTSTNINGQNKKYCLTPNCVKVAASVIEAIDLTVDPCDDFYVRFMIHYCVCSRQVTQ